MQTAPEFGKHKSTVSRAVRMDKAKLYKDAGITYQLQKSAYQEGGEKTPSINLRDPETLETYLSLLTPKQIQYITLYYGEGMSMQEVSICVGRDKTTISRTIGRGIAQIRARFLDEVVNVEGLEVLGSLLSTTTTGQTKSSRRRPRKTGIRWSSRKLHP